VGANVDIDDRINDKAYRLLLNSFALLQGLKNEFIYGGYLTSLGCPAFVLSVALMLNTAVDWPVLLIAYLTPLIVYSYNYYAELEKDALTNPERVAHLSKKIKLYPYILVFYGAVLALLLIRYANYMMMLFVLILLFCGIFYTILLKEITKQIPGFKGVYIASVWALAGAFFFNFHYSLNWDVFTILIFVFIFSRGIINVTFFDIKDMDGDREQGLKTIPVILGRDWTLKLLYGLNIVTFLPLLVGVYLGVFPYFALALLIFYLYDDYYLHKAAVVNNKVLRKISYTLADAEFILWPLILILGKILLS